MNKTGRTLLLAVWGLVANVAVYARDPLIPDQNTRQSLISFLRETGEWAITHNVAAGELAIPQKYRTSIFINSNLARVLLALHDLTGEETYRRYALAWFDRLASLQQTTLSARGDTVGYWGDMSPSGNIYLGDAGTSATALAGALRHADPAQQARYLQALRRYADFVRYGCKEDPQNKNRGGSPGWIISDGKDAGAVGCGYYRGQLSLAPYTIATSVTGAAFFSALAEWTGEAEYMTIAENAVAWLLRQRRPDGEIPYILHNSMLTEWPLDTMSYASDGFISVHSRSPRQKIRQLIESEMRFSLQWLLNRMNKAGVWGRLRSQDQQRSQGSLNLLVWYYDQVSANQDVRQAIQRNYEFFLNRRNAEAYGMNELPISIGFVGLGLAEVLEPGITYRIRE